MIRIYFICYLCLSMCSENHRLTFRRVIKKGSVEEFSCVPYILALFNCLLYTWYGLPVVSSGWENSTVSSINGLGILLEIAFISIYTWFAPRERKAICVANGATRSCILCADSNFFKLSVSYARFTQSFCG
ncbi:Os01g0220700 [Oryza sativa Japonica Group]|uniref:Os01g0220700 protein n=1 Tax=Oryza sativa subsp. japonica TaxID=39947 RepID=A0A0P0V0L5_ORYSJ|nr:hypothetical protein EE612_001110 [Oryza sativa]BAS71070.1 Os01g0220700 [Oryza sativa Japonica Group]